MGRKETESKLQLSLIHGDRVGPRFENLDSLFISNRSV